MEKGTKEQSQEEYSRMVNSNSMLLTFEGWIKYIEGFIKGLEATDKISSDSVLGCIGEILEYMVSFKGNLLKLLLHCEEILKENEELKSQLNTPKLPVKLEEMELEDDEDL